MCASIWIPLQRCCWFSDSQHMFVSDSMTQYDQYDSFQKCAFCHLYRFEDFPMALGFRIFYWYSRAVLVDRWSRQLVWFLQTNKVTLSMWIQSRTLVVTHTKKVRMAYYTCNTCILMHTLHCANKRQYNVIIWFSYSQTIAPPFHIALWQ